MTKKREVPVMLKSAKVMSFQLSLAALKTLDQKRKQQALMVVSYLKLGHHRTA